MTFDELQKVGFVEHHRCGACGAPVGYIVHPEMAGACFSSGWDCSGNDTYRILTHEELASIPSAALTNGDTHVDD